MAPMYNALPKNTDGLLSRTAAGFLVQKYFSQVHRFFIKGIGYEAATREEDEALVHQESILQTEAPELMLVELEARHSGRGLDLSDVVAMAATLHVFVVRSAAALLWQAFDALHAQQLLPADDSLSLDDVTMLFRAWVFVTKFDPKDQRKFLDRMSNPTHIMSEFGKLAQNLLQSQDYREKDQRNPFAPRTYKHMELMDLALEVLKNMGTWQDQDCKVMKTYLGKLDVESTGRVPLATIFEQPAAKDESGMTVFRFSESQDNLRETGSLDESDPASPQLLISNYILGPPNCYRFAAYHTYCCLNECDGLMSEIEKAIQGPTAAPEMLINLVGNLSSSSMDEPQAISRVLWEKLLAIAALHGGVVPLHGRLFVQWLHFVFPQECPYPHVTHKDASGNALMTSFFQPAAEAAGAASNRSLHTAELGGLSAQDSAFLTQWSDEEFLPFAEVQRSGAGAKLRLLLRVGFLAAAVLALMYHFRSVASSGLRALGLCAPPKVQRCSVFETAIDKVA